MKCAVHEEEGSEASIHPIKGHTPWIIGPPDTERASYKQVLSLLVRKEISPFVHEVGTGVIETGPIFSPQAERTSIKCKRLILSYNG